MSRTVRQGFDAFLQRLTPTEAERNNATSHRASVEAAVSKYLDEISIWETGSFSHGTAIRRNADVDLLVSFASTKRPQRGTSALNSVKTALRHRYALTDVVVRSPAVVIRFASGQHVEVIPGFVHSTGGAFHTYQVPQPGSGGWMVSAPSAHLAYVNETNKSPSGGTKRLARLLKAWKYYQQVPISSFYFEMRAAEYMKTQTSFIPLMDLTYVLRSLARHGLASMNDPKGVSGRISPCSSQATLTTSKSKLSTAVGRADKAMAADGKARPDEVFHYLDLLFGGRFPAR